jgi:peptidoglycan/LPS O-acetylase OafA/YrhL
MTLVHLLSVQTWWPIPLDLTVAGRFDLAWSISTSSGFSTRVPIFGFSSLAQVPCWPSRLYAVWRRSTNPGGRLVLSWRPLIYVGTISYSLYLFHAGTTMWIAARLGLHIFGQLDYASFDMALLPLFGARVTAGLVLTLAVASAGYYLIERPGQTFLRSFSVANIAVRPLRSR